MQRIQHIEQLGEHQAERRTVGKPVHYGARCQQQTDELQFFQQRQPFFDERPAAVQALGNELRRHGFPARYVDKAVVVNRSGHVLQEKPSGAE